ncbi:MAG TPA: DUF4190 domain-containing protein [Actinotalea sp.]|nr:DUF4190 domain-containing protein [Actinotalea sp.]
MSQPTPPPYEGQQPYQQQPGYQQPAYPQQYAQQGYGYPQQQGNNSLALVSLIAGIANFVIIPFIGAVVALITGYMGKKQIAETGQQGEGMAKAGIILGWIGVAVSLIGIVAFIVFFAAAASTSGFTTS